MKPRLKRSPAIFPHWQTRCGWLCVGAGHTAWGATSAIAYERWDRLYTAAMWSKTQAEKAQFFTEVHERARGRSWIGRVLGLQ